jgi:hypothetical protein
MHINDSTCRCLFICRQLFVFITNERDSTGENMNYMLLACKYCCSRSLRRVRSVNTQYHFAFLSIFTLMKINHKHTPKCFNHSTDETHTYTGHDCTLPNDTYSDVNVFLDLLCQALHAHLRTCVCQHIDHVLCLNCGGANSLNSTIMYVQMSLLNYATN